MIYDEKLKNRLKRIEGQVRGILKMMEEGKDCRDLVTQMSAVRNAIDKAIAVAVSTNLELCVRQQIEKGEDTEELIQEAIQLLVKSR